MLDKEQVYKYTEKCFSGEPASCTFACPFHLDIRALLKKAAKGRLAAAAKDLRGVIPLPVIVNSLCDKPCERACQRRTVMEEEPVSIAMVLEACLNAPKKKERGTYMPPLTDKKIAVIGAGAVGLTFAYHMYVKRCAVTVFDKKETWGGSLIGHPDFESFHADITAAFADSDVAFRFGTEIKSLAELSDFDAVFIATGKDGSDFGAGKILDTDLGVTETAGVFIGGEKAGHTTVVGMARALDAAKAVEAYIKAGDPFYGAERWDSANACRYAPHDKDESAPHIIPAGEGYTAEEAQAEAGRCMQCDCDRCMDACEFLPHFKKKPPRITQDIAQDGTARNSISSACITRQTWSCNLCGRCNSMCKDGADIAGLFELSRRDRVTMGGYPTAIHAYRLREFEEATGEASLLVKPEGACEYLFFPGCRLGGTNPEYVTKSVEALRKKSPAVGLMLNCCGTPALWAGEGEKFDAHIAFLRKTWQELGCPKIVYACMSCRRIFARFLPEIELVSLYELLKPDGGTKLFDSAAVFDPCAAAGMDEVKAAVRRLSADAGMSISDYDSDGKCCGFGGHMRLANQGLYDTITKNRCAETDEPFIVYCVNCGDTFKAEGKSCAHILDAVFGLTPAPLMTLGEKARNALKTKKLAMEKFMNERYDIPANPWDSLNISVTPEALKKMERSLIPDSDVKRTIWENEESGYGFMKEDGTVLCRLVLEYITCWVEYHMDGGAYVVTDVYSHRMRMREEF